METESTLQHAPSTLSREIDQGRLHNQWNAVVKMLEDLARTCDIGAARRDVDANRRTYFWTVWAETLLELDHDYQKAMLCIGKAIELDHDAIEWRIIFVRLLLEWTGNVIIPGFTRAPYDFVHGGIKPSGITKDLAANMPANKQQKSYLAREVLADVLKEFPPGEQQIILEQFPEDSLHYESCQAVLFALSILPLQSRQQCCHDILLFLREKDWKSLRLKSSLTFVVYLICIDSLRVVSCDEIYETIYIETINEYTMYLQIDAVIGRSIIYEALGDYDLARDTIDNLIYNVLPDSDADIDTLKLSFQSSTLYAVCRLPLLERICGFLEVDELRQKFLFAESLSSFKRCVSNSSLLRSRISTATNSALTFSASTMLLKRAKISTTTEIEESDIANALSLLQASQETMESYGPSPKPFEHLPQSLILRLPFTLSSPESITSFATPGRIAILLSSVSTRLGKSLSNSVEILEWSVNFEVQLDLELLWSMADAYAQGEDQGKAISLFQQAHDTLMIPQEAIHAHDIIYSKQKSEFSEIVSWLSNGPHPSVCPWLPTIRSTNICLDRLSDPKRAIAILMQNAKDLYPTKFEMLDKFCKSFNYKVKNVDPVIALTLSMIEEGNIKENSSVHFSDADESVVNHIGRNTTTQECKLSMIDNINDVSFKEVKKSCNEHIQMLGETTHSGFMEILFELGRAYAMISRSENEKKVANRGYRKGALVIFSIIIKYHEEIFSDLSCPEKLLLEFAVVLAEEGMLTAAKNIVKQGINLHKNSTQLAHLLGLLHSCVGGDVEDINIAINVCNDTFSSKSSMNVGLTLALLKWSAGEKEACLNIMDNLVAALRDNMSYNEWSRHSNAPDEGLPRNVVFDQYVLNWDRSPQALRLSTEILVNASEIFRRCGMLEKARSCTDMAWKLLYSVNSKSMYDLNFTDELDRVELLRKLPQSSGWRLRDASGWGSVRIPDCEAEIISECAAQYLAEGDVITSTELYKIALMEFPHHVPSLIALAELELLKPSGCDDYQNVVGSSNVDVIDFKRFINMTTVGEYKDNIDCTRSDFIPTESTNENNAYVQEGTYSNMKALHYASLAVRFDDEISETWYLVGKVYEALSCNDEAKVALWKALELGNQFTVRKFKWSLMDA